MRNKYSNFIIFAAAVVFWAALPAAAQNACSKQTGDRPVAIEIRNATGKAFTVHYVDENCKESASDEKIEPGRMFKGDTTEGHVFRVREDGSNKVIRDVTADPSNTTATIGVVRNSNPRESFIETLNNVRHGRNLPAMEYDSSLNNACQWFADLMAKYDHGGHDAVEVGGGSYADMQHPWMRTKKLGYVGDGGTEATAEGDTPDLSVLGGDAMIGWSSSDTHHRPFLSQDGQIFKQVGFGYAKSAKKPNYYYTCAVFGNPPEKNPGNAGSGEKNDPQPANDAPAKDPVKTDVPTGLKFHEAKFFQEINGEEKYATSFARGTLTELNASFSFENPSSQPFSVEARCYFNGKMISSEPLTDLKGSGSMSVLAAGKNGEPGRVQGGAYRFEILLNGEVVLTAEAMVK